MSALTLSDVRGLLAVAKVAAETAEQVYQDCEHAACSGCEHEAASVAADREVERIEAILRDPATPGARSWKLYEEDHHYETAEFASAAEALAAAVGAVDRNNYPSAEQDECASTMFIDVRVECDETGETDSEMVVCDPAPPPCDAAKHDWQSPVEIVGGCDENPGVRGHGGGVVVVECCMHCGCQRTTDTWATNPRNGTQGHESVMYEPGHYADELDAYRAAVAAE